MEIAIENTKIEKIDFSHILVELDILKDRMERNSPTAIEQLNQVMKLVSGEHEKSKKHSEFFYKLANVFQS